MPNAHFLANNFLEVLTHPRTPNEPFDKITLQKIKAHLESATDNLNNHNNAINKTLLLLAMTLGQVENLSFKSEITNRLNQTINSNLSTVSAGNKTAMYISLLLGQAVSKDKTLYHAIELSLNNNFGPLYQKIHDIKLTNKLGIDANQNLAQDNKPSPRL